MLNESEQRKKLAFNFFSKSIVLLLGLLLLFFFFRVYLFLNIVFANISFSYYEVFQMFIWGIRFDLCVLGFFVMPVYVILILSLFLNKSRIINLFFSMGYFYIAILYLLTFAVYYFNLPFIITNSGFGIPYWMRWEDYQSLWDLNIYPSYWHYHYLSEFQSFHLILVTVFSSLLSFTLLPSPSWHQFKSLPFLFVSFLLITMMARGKLGEHHIRFEDSRFSNSQLINELSLNPIWVLNKSKEQLSQD